MRLTLSDRKLIACSTEEKEKLVETARIMKELSERARKRGLLALEEAATEYHDPFIKSTIMLIIDAMEPDTVEQVIDNMIICSDVKGADLLKMLIVERGVLLIQRGCNPNHIFDEVLDYLGQEIKEKTLASDLGGELAIIPPLRKIAGWLKTIFDGMDEEREMESILNLSSKDLIQLCIFLPPARAAYIISKSPKEKGLEIIEGIINIHDGEMARLHDIENYLRIHLLLKPTQSIIYSADTFKLVADIMNAMDKTLNRCLFDELYRTDAKLANEIRRNMFSFNDIVNLDDMAIQRLLQEVNSRDLILALKGSDPSVVNVLLKGMSERMAETIKDDLEYIHNIRTEDVKESQRRILLLINKLEDSGDIRIEHKVPEKNHLFN
jgi:hypothetical protein